MKLAFFSVIAVAATLTLAPSSALSQATQRRFPHGASPSGLILWTAKNVVAKDGTHTWHYTLYTKDTGDAATPLCESFSLGISISPDDHWILVQDGTSSLGLHLRLFKQTAGAHYEEQKVDIDDVVEKLLAQSSEGKKVDLTLLDHTYLHCLGWSKEGKASLEFTGKGAAKGQKIEVGPFACSLVPDPLSATVGAPASLVQDAPTPTLGGPRRPKPPQRITFEKGVTSAKLHGSLTPQQQQARYIFKAEKSQKLFVKIVPGTGLVTSGHLIFPSGKQDGMPGGVIFDGPLDESGDYLLTVTPHRMATDSDHGDFDLEVALK